MNKKTWDKIKLKLKKCLLLYHYSYLDSKNITEFERWILEKTLNTLNQEDAELIREQLTYVYRVDRSPDSREVLLYMKKKHKNVSMPLFDNLDEFVISKLKLNSNSVNGFLRVKIWAVSGRIFIIEYNKNYLPFEEDFLTGEIKCEDIIVH